MTLDAREAVSLVRRTLEALKFDFAHTDDPFELELVAHPSEADRDVALAALDVLEKAVTR